MQDDSVGEIHQTVSITSLKLTHKIQESMYFISPQN